MPKPKEKPFAWHTSGQEWVYLSLDDLGGAMREQLGDCPSIINLVGKVGRDRTTPFIWLLGCSKPLKWGWKEGCWLTCDGSEADLGKVPKPTLCKEWVQGKGYRYWWVRCNGHGGFDRSNYFNDESSAKSTLSLSRCTWYGEDDVDERVSAIAALEGK